LILIKSLEIESYRNIRHARLDDLREFNILIGANNCGKTSILNAITVLTRLVHGSSYDYLCPNCEKIRKSSTQSLAGFCFLLDARDSYLQKGQAKISFSFNQDEVEKQVPGVLQKQEKILSGTSACYRKELVARERYGTLIGEHLSIFTHDDILEWLKRIVLLCPEGRLQTYRDKPIREYVQGKIVRGDQYRKWLSFLKQLVDPKISDYTQILQLVRETDGQGFETTIEEQGSGVRSLVCLMADILSSEDTKILLVDEPELGLNPSSKQRLLQFLLREIERKQIFIATHDPTFVNPSLWKGYDVSVFLHSLSKGEFVRINLKENKEDPETFAGYLPQTTSLKDIQIYVEGSSDVYILETFLRRYLKDACRDWSEVIRKIGIYHLGGDFWPHLLYTIPDCPPYKCIVVFDGDKREVVREEYEKFEGFEFCRDLKELKKVIGTCKPIYCWRKERIDDYLFLTPPGRRPLDYDKKRNGPKFAEEMKFIPKEIKDLFDVITGNSNIVRFRIAVRHENQSMQ